LVEDERGDLLGDSHKIINRWNNYFCQLLDVHGEGGVRQTEMHTAKPLVPQCNVSDIEVAIGKLKIAWFLSGSSRTVSSMSRNVVF
jgi:hypothetical protein